MKSALALTVIVCLVASALPVTAAQQPAETPGSFDLRAASPVTVGLLTRSIAREAVRPPAAEEPTAGEVVRQTGNPVESNWSRVRKLASGRGIVVTVKGSPPARRHFVAGDKADLTVVNLTDPTLPAAARDVLRDMATTHPDYFAVANKQSFVNGTVRVAPDGVFVTDRKVADLGQVVETIARNDIAEIKTRQKGRGVWGHLGSLGGYFVGAMSGGFVAGFACQAAVGRDRCDTGAFLTGALAGGIAGGIYGFRAANRETEDVIYRGP
ncbi:MAG TPA: hypothetical protein VGY48_32340 [Vicinamibacterales bacterium]|jgi:hypothetical protein|nr:hypothetical protein [Vicinamibacterales bacterium]